MSSAYRIMDAPPKLTFEEGDSVVCAFGRGVITKKWQNYCNHCNRHHGQIEYTVALHSRLGPDAVVLVNYVAKDK